MKFFKYGITLIIACFHIPNINAQKTIFDAIRSNDSLFVKNIQKGDCRILMYEKESGYAPLHTAILLDDEADALHFAQLLIERGAIVNQPNSNDGKTALHYAVDQRDLILVYYLLQQDADPKIENVNDLNVFLYACKSNQFSMARLILFFYKKRLQQYVRMPKEIIDLLYRTHATQITEEINKFNAERENQARKQLVKPIEAFDFEQFDCYQDAVQKQYTAGIRSNL